jgi:upstream activation factor subunit UAF30
MATKKKGGAKRAGARKSGAKKKSSARKSAAKKKGGARKAAKRAPARKSAGRKKTAAKKKTARKGAAKKKRAPNPAFMKPMQPDDTLAAVVGNKPMPRTEVTKKLWGYIKKNNLQDAKERRMINADDKLRPVFGGKRQVSMFEMTKHVNAHLK